MPHQLNSNSLVKKTLPMLDDYTHYGNGALSHLEKIIREHQNIVLFYDEGAYHPSGAAQIIEPLKSRIPLHVFSYSGMALPVKDIQEIYLTVKEIDRIGLIVAVGGGTILDLAKTIALAYANKSASISALIAEEKRPNTIPLLLIPTTCGTGSEATSFAAIFKDKTKISLSHPSLRPRFKILDPNLLHSLPDNVLGPVVLDSLAQAVESIWAVAANSESQRYATQAIRLILAGLNLMDSSDRFGPFLLASHLSGKAINISKTTMCHSISYPLSSHFGIPHGVAVFLSLAKIAQLNFHVQEGSLQNGMSMDRLRKSFKIIFEAFGVETIDQLTSLFNETADSLKVTRRLRDLGVKRKDIPFIVSQAYTPERASNNPRKIDERSIEQLLGEIY